MSNYYNAFEMSPVPTPGVDAVAPEPFRGIYGMPMFVIVPTRDLAASERFWRDALGFFNLFAIPGSLTHLRRWAFQDVLLVPAATQADTDTDFDTDIDAAPAASVSFACVLGEIESIAAACESVRPGCAKGPRATPWNTVDLEITTPERLRVIFTAAKPFDPASQEARNLAGIGIVGPEETPGA
jgi:hypothetical protein